MNELYSYKVAVIPASVKDADQKKGIVTGYFSSFNNVDSDGDIIRRGAFSKTVKDMGPESTQPRIKHLFNHDPFQPLGKILSLVEDDKGLLYESQIGSHQLGKDFIQMVDSGLITEHSIGYKIIKRNQLQDFDAYQKNPDEGWYELTELKLFEGSSLSAWGANAMTPIVGMKTKTHVDKMVKQYNVIEQFCKNSTASDETIENLLIYCKQLQQTIIDLTQKQATKPSALSSQESRTHDTLPDVTSVFNNFRQQLTA